MPRMSFEGVVGTVLALIVVILDQAGVKNPWVLWGAFLVAIIVCLDASLRSGWGVGKKISADLIIVLAFMMFGGYLFHRLSVTPTVNITGGIPISPPVVGPPPPSTPSVKSNQQQSGHHNVQAGPITQKGTNNIAQVGNT